jgi:hypothetical protein
MTEHRPSRIGDVDIHDAVAQVRETEDVWKLYRKEWLLVPGGELANYEGRLLPEDIKHSANWGGGNNYVRLWNVKGEFKTRELAETHAALVTQGEVRVVARSSRDEQQLKAYGKRMLPKASSIIT